MIVSSDGTRMLALGFSSLDLPSEVMLWDTRSGGKSLLHLTGHSGFINQVCFSPDGKRVAAACVTDKAIKLWDAKTGQETLTLRGHDHGVRCIGFSHDGKRLASVDWLGAAKVWDAINGKELATLDYAFMGYLTAIENVALNNDGTRLAVAGTHVAGTHLGIAVDDQAVVWDTTTSKSIRSLKTTGLHLEGSPLLQNTAGRFAISPDGRWVAAAARTNDNKEWVTAVWSAISGKLAFTLRGHTSTVSHVEFSPDSRYIFTASHDKTVRIWSVRSGQEVRTFRGHSAEIETLAYDPEGKRLVSANNPFRGMALVLGAAPRNQPSLRPLFARDMRLVPGIPAEVKVWDSLPTDENALPPIPAQACEQPDPKTSKTETKAP